MNRQFRAPLVAIILTGAVVSLANWILTGSSQTLIGRVDQLANCMQEAFKEPALASELHTCTTPGVYRERRVIETHAATYLHTVEGEERTC